MEITFNIPYMTGNETRYIKDAVETKKISGNGKYTKRCQNYFETNYGFKKCLLTTSCTDALEMAAILLNIKEGDEVIVPSYTFVSTANAFVLRGAKIVFIDSNPDNPCMDVTGIETLITPRTKAIVPVHYAGIACDMDEIMSIARKHNIYVVEDAAHAIDSYYLDKNGEARPLGSMGDFAAFSFHESKNIISGEGGMLVINNQEFVDRAEVIWEKGTNRSAFFRGDVSKYDWMDIGSSFLPSEVIAAFLWAQIEQIDDIQSKRQDHWHSYRNGLKEWASRNHIELPIIPDYATNNGHLFYLVCKDTNQRDRLIHHLDINGVLAVFHYLGLHRSPFYKPKHDKRSLKESERYTKCLARLPLYYSLKQEEIEYIINTLESVRL